MVVAILLNSRHDAEVDVCDGKWYMDTLMRNMPSEDLDGWWNYFISFDCIVGGFDFSINYWCVLLTLGGGPTLNLAGCGTRIATNRNWLLFDGV
jgi:hypothetical protein